VQLEISRDFRHKGSTTEPLETLGGVKSPQLAGLSATSEENSLKRRMDGWGGRIRTSAWWNQNQATNSMFSKTILKKASNSALNVSIR
jgi:hypothetical protein